MTTLNPEVLTAAKSAVDTLQTEVEELRRSGLTLSQGARHLGEAVNVLQTTGKSFGQVGTRLHHLAEEVSRLDPSALDGRLAELASTLTTTEQHLRSAIDDATRASTQGHAKLGTSLGELRGQIEVVIRGIDDTKTLVAALAARLAEHREAGRLEAEILGEQISATSESNLKAMAERLERVQAEVTRQFLSEQQTTRLLLSEATGRLRTLIVVCSILLFLAIVGATIATLVKGSGG
jgi:hypothetical protein